MTEPFAQMLAVGGKSNSLGRAEEVVKIALKDRSRLEELYNCLFAEDEWVRMRAADALEKVCRVQPQWLEPYVDRFFQELADSIQPSIQWHLAQMFGEIDLAPAQKQKAIAWLSARLETPEADWIVAANAMQTLTAFTREGDFAKDKLVPLLERQQKHRSNAVVKRATKLLKSLE